MRILIAEDDQVLADALLRSLRTSGAAVDRVATGSQADAALMTNSEFDLLILDLGLPNMHGLEILKRLRARGSCASRRRITSMLAVKPCRKFRVPTGPNSPAAKNPPTGTLP